MNIQRATITGSTAIVITHSGQRAVLRNVRTVLKRIGRALWKVLAGDILIFTPSSTRLVHVEYRLMLASWVDKIVTCAKNTLRDLLSEKGTFIFECALFRVALQWS